MQRLSFPSITFADIDKIESSNKNEVIRSVLNFLFIFFFHVKFSQVQKRIKTQVEFFIKCRLKVDLLSLTYVYIYLKATVKKFYHDY